MHVKGSNPFTCNEVYKMEKERVTDKRKSKKKNYEDNGYIAHNLHNPGPNPKPKKLCKNCKAEIDLVKTRGLLNIYKCPNCSFTTEEWV